MREPILFSFLSDILPRHEVFFEPETIYYRKIKKTVLNTIRLYLEIIDHEEVNFIGETLTFTLQFVKIQFYAE